MKFRVRDLARNIWLEATETSLHAFTDYYLTLDGSVTAFEGSISEPAQVALAALDHTDYSKRPIQITKEKDRFVVQQCTELTDKNGKELYVGDLVQADEQEWEVCFWKGAFMVIPVENDKNVGFYTALYEFPDCLHSGNIFDNVKKNPPSNPT